MEIHIVYYESGEYSDYTSSVAGVFSTKEKAEAYAKRKNDELISQKKHYSNCRFDGASYDLGRTMELDVEE